MTKASASASFTPSRARDDPVRWYSVLPCLLFTLGLHRDLMGACLPAPLLLGWCSPINGSGEPARNS